MYTSAKQREAVGRAPGATLRRVAAGDLPLTWERAAQLAPARPGAATGVDEEISIGARKYLRSRRRRRITAIRAACPADFRAVLLRNSADLYIQVCIYTRVMSVCGCHTGTINNRALACAPIGDGCGYVCLRIYRIGSRGTCINRWTIVYLGRVYTPVRTKKEGRLIWGWWDGCSMRRGLVSLLDVASAQRGPLFQ